MARVRKARNSTARTVIKKKTSCALPHDLDKIYKEAKRWESMPNRSEALTPEMVEHLYDKGTASHQDSAIAALADWSVLNLQAGFRISEYA